MEGMFSRGERRLTVPEYVGLVASCQAGLDAAMAELPPTSQVELWNALQPDTFLPSSGKRLLWVLRRGVLDDLAPLAESVLTRSWLPEPTEHDQLAFRAVLEALATGRQRLSDITAFCNEIHAWPSVLGVADYLNGNLAATVQLAMTEVDGDRLTRKVRLPSWSLVGTLLEALGAVPGRLDAALPAFTAALATVLGPEGRQFMNEHALVVAELYRATDGGRRSSAPEMSLRASLGAAPQGPALDGAAGDKFDEVVQALQRLQLVQAGTGQTLCWTAVTLVHLPPGQPASAL